MAIIFDMDGVLIDSEPLWRRAEVEVLGAVGVPLTEQMCAQTTGLPIVAAVDHWFQRFPWRGPSPEDLADAVVRRVSALVAREGVAMAGAVELVRDLHGAGALLGLCSSSPMSLIEVVCDRLALTRLLRHAADGRRLRAGEAVPGSLSRDGAAPGRGGRAAAWPSRTRAPGSARRWLPG